MDLEAAIPSNLSSEPGALMQLGCMLMERGDSASAIALVRKMLHDHPDDGQVESAVRMILTRGVPSYHGTMLADAPRNSVFERAIIRAAPGATVLDIGAGSGLLSMMAARAGAAKVFACELNAVIAETARDIIAANGFADRVEVVAKSSRNVDRDVDLGGGVDLVVSEVFSANLIGEGVLETLHHARNHLTNPGAQIIPAEGFIRTSLVFYEDDTPDLSDVHGFDLSLFERHLMPDRATKIGNKNLQLRSETGTLFAFDFANGFELSRGRAELRLTAQGHANGIVRWIRLRLDDHEDYENAPQPGATSHWAGWLTPLPAAVEEGASVTIHAAHDINRLQLWFS